MSVGSPFISGISQSPLGAYRESAKQARDYFDLRANLWMIDAGDKEMQWWKHVPEGVGSSEIWSMGPIADGVITFINGQFRKHLALDGSIAWTNNTTFAQAGFRNDAVFGLRDDVGYYRIHRISTDDGSTMWTSGTFPNVGVLMVLADVVVMATWYGLFGQLVLYTFNYSGSLLATTSDIDGLAAAGLYGYIPGAGNSFLMTGGGNFLRISWNGSSWSKICTGGYPYLQWSHGLFDTGTEVLAFVDLSSLYGPIPPHIYHFNRDTGGFAYDTSIDAMGSRVLGAATAPCSWMSGKIINVGQDAWIIDPARGSAPWKFTAIGYQGIPPFQSESPSLLSVACRGNRLYLGGRTSHRWDAVDPSGL